MGGWRQKWYEVEQRLNDQAAQPPQWVAVAYADAALAEAPAIEQVLEAAIQRDCVGFLVDTWSKSSGSLFDWATPFELQQLFAKAKSAGLLTAVAGRVSTGDLPRLLSLKVDIIGMRSAVCLGNDRTAAVEESRVASMKQAIHEAAQQ